MYWSYRLDKHPRFSSCRFDSLTQSLRAPWLVQWFPWWPTPPEPSQGPAVQLCPYREDNEHNDAICSAIRSMSRDMLLPCSFLISILLGILSGMEWHSMLKLCCNTNTQHQVQETSVRQSDSPSSFRSSCPCPFDVSFHASSLPVAAPLSEALFRRPCVTLV